MITFKEEASPSTPSTGYVRFYAKTDGKLYYKADDGSEKPLAVQTSMQAFAIAMAIALG